MPMGSITQYPYVTKYSEWIYIAFSFVWVIREGKEWQDVLDVLKPYGL